MAGYIDKERARELLPVEDYARLFPSNNKVSSRDLPTTVESTESEEGDKGEEEPTGSGSSSPVVSENKTNGLSAVVKNLHNAGRNKGDNNIPPELRSIAGATANIPGVTTKEVSEAFGISPSQVNNFKEGITTRANGTNAALATSVKADKKALSKQAVETAMKAIGLIDDDKLSDLKAPQLASVAKDMSAISRNTSDEGSHNQQNVQIIFMTPQQKKEDAFGVIEVEAAG